MTILIGVSDEFLDWLQQCPVHWFLEKQTNDTVTYTFDKGGD